MVPVMIGTTWAWKLSGGENFRVVPAILCFLFAFLMQIDSNFINDYFDCLKGNDDRATRLGPKRACSEGWITLPAMRIGLVITSLLASLVGIPLIFFGGWEMILVGVACVLFAFLYTTYFSYLGLGDVLVLALGLMTYLQMLLLLFSGKRDNLLPFIFVFIIFIPYGILHYKTAMQMKQIKKGKELNIILAQTARNMLIYGIATTIALVSL